MEGHILFELRTAQNGLPIVLMTLLCGCARAPVRQHHQHNWAPFWFYGEGSKTQEKPPKTTLSMVPCAGRPCCSPQVHFLLIRSHMCKILAGVTKVLDIWAQRTQKHATCTVYMVRPAQCTPSLSHVCHAVQVLPTLVFTMANTAHSWHLERLVGGYS